MSTQKNKQKGDYGEDLACKYLRNNGYEIVHRNWQAGHNEIDIIAMHKAITVFVEVKLRHTDEYGHPEQAVGAKKITELRRAANEYIASFDLEEIRFDIIAITLWPERSPEIVHFEDAFF
jgi:putative endonuclease